MNALRFPLAAGLSLAALLIAAPPLTAHPGHSYSIDALTRYADTVIEGEVENVSAAWNADHTQITTHVRVRVDETLKGGARSAAVEFAYLGGTVGDITLAVLGQASFQAHERVLVFLQPDWRAGEYPVVGGEHGKFSVMTDSATGQVYYANEGTTVLRANALRQVRTTLSAQPSDR